MATATFRMVAVPIVMLKKDARIPAIRYFLNPKTPQMATAIGAESWNSVPGTRPGMRKTPLTAIIGYADMLRSRKLDEEKSFLSANYIYTEGKRLEAMSLRLLDIIVTKKEEVQFQLVPAASLFDYLKDMFASHTEMEFHFQYESGMVRAEANLIKSVLVNLLDNACKASEPGSPIEVRGKLTERGYRFEVKDMGVGIPREEQKNITKAFYMVDKSRSRSKNGAGLGLALCAEILLLHGSKLEIESEPGKGSCISFVLPDKGGME